MPGGGEREREREKDGWEELEGHFVSVSQILRSHLSLGSDQTLQQHSAAAAGHSHRRRPSDSVRVHGHGRQCGGRTPRGHADSSNGIFLLGGKMEKERDSGGGGGGGGSRSADRSHVPHFSPSVCRSSITTGETRTTETQIIAICRNLKFCRTPIILQISEYYEQNSNNPIVKNLQLFSFGRIFG